MRLEAKIQGVPLADHLCVRCGAVRQQRHLADEVFFDVQKPPVPLELRVFRRSGGISKAALDECRGEDGLYKVHLRSKDGHSMSVTFRTRKWSEDKKVPTSEEEAAAEAYLQKHSLPQFVKKVFDQLLTQQPKDPYQFMRLLWADAARAEQTSSLNARPASELKVQEDTAVEMPITPGQEVHQTRCRDPQRLRSKARETLSKSYLNGSLAKSLNKLFAKKDVANQLPEDGEVAASKGCSLQELRLKAKEALSKSYLNQSLGTSLQKLSASKPAAFGRLLDQVAKPSLAVSDASVRRKAKAGLIKAFQNGRLQLGLGR
ncbi:Vegetative incompatibility protein HET-E-1 [Durusdinium trenchii]|uniref:Vegetative incompatibility protein HET-E-1 n=1 Tax=Durusdinium trenchii TaxID=1381693 RepID=A0ABP0PC04_9DINO